MSAASPARLGLLCLPRSVAFYRELFGTGPTKARPGYAKFEVAEPPVNLALNEVNGETGPSHPVAHRNPGTTLWQPVPLHWLY